MGFRHVNKLVNEFIEPNAALAKQHHNDLRCTALTLFSATVDGPRKGRMLSFVDAILDASKVIEETTVMREQMKGDEAAHKKELIYWHLESDRDKMTHGIPNKVNSFAGFQNKKSCKVKDCAIVKGATDLIKTQRKLKKIALKQPSWFVGQTQSTRGWLSNWWRSCLSLKLRCQIRDMNSFCKLNKSSAH